MIKVQINGLGNQGDGMFFSLTHGNAAGQIWDVSPLPLRFHNALRYITCCVISEAVIRSFNDKRTETIFGGRRAKGLPTEIQQRARRKLRMLDAATAIDDLKVPPSNRLEKLKGDRRGQHSIRINDQWRICFVWHDKYASKVEIIDYH